LGVPGSGHGLSNGGVSRVSGFNNIEEVNAFGISTGICWCCLNTSLASLGGSQKRLESNSTSFVGLAGLNCGLEFGCFVLDSESVSFAKGRIVEASVVDFRSSACYAVCLLDEVCSLGGR